MIHNWIFLTNVIQILEEKGMTSSELSEKSGVSISYLSDLTSGKANPSLKVMSSIAKALDTPLTALLEMSDLSEDEALKISEGERISSLPKGYVRFCGVFPEHKAFQIKKWNDETVKQLKASRKR